jgi:hypothetical protein
MRLMTLLILFAFSVLYGYALADEKPVVRKID